MDKENAADATICGILFQDRGWKSNSSHYNGLLSLDSHVLFYAAVYSFF
jgi:hypothetical protein